MSTNECFNKLHTICFHRKTETSLLKHVKKSNDHFTYSLKLYINQQSNIHNHLKSTLVK